MAWLRTAAAIDWNLVRSIAEQARAEVTDDLSVSSTGACMDATWTIWEALTGLGYNAQMVDGLFKVEHGYEDIPWDDGFCDKGYLAHHWVELDGKVVDATADQFNQFLARPMPDVFIGNDGKYMGPADTPSF